MGRGTTNRAALTAAIVGLALMITAAFSPALQNGFVSFDDDRYIVDNPRIRAGLTPAGVRWAFAAPHGNNWHPLTWVSHMLDISLFGLQPAGHHLMGLLLHGANAILLLAVLRGMTGALWPAALAAALFALHPLRVESVAWAAERKDLLSGFFWMLTMGAYLRYVQRPAPRRLVPVVVLLAAGLLAKSMAVTLPFVLLILDWWPLGRLRPAGNPGGGRSSRRLLVEKFPLLLVSALAAAVTLRVQSLGGATAALPFLSWETRLSNAVVSSVRYLELTFRPVRLSYFYPHPEAPWPAAQTATAAAFLVVIGLLAVWARRRAPAVAAGWVWFLVTLVPVIGLVQVGYQAMADRYTYLPTVGVAVALVWGARQLTRSRTVLIDYFEKSSRGAKIFTRRFLCHCSHSPGMGKHSHREKRTSAFLGKSLCSLAGETPALRALTAVALAACLLLTLQTRRQVGYWRDDRALFGRALELDGGNWQAHLSYGAMLGREGRFEEAIPHYRRTLQTQPLNAQALSNLGVALLKVGRGDEGLRSLRDAVALAPDFPAAHYNLGLALSEAGRREEAIPHLLAAIRLQPSDARAFNALGIVLSSLGRVAEGIGYLRDALASDPGFAEAHYNLGVALYRQGQSAAAAAEFLAVLRLDQGHVDALYNLGVIAAAAGRGADAEGFFRRALVVNPGMVPAHLGLGVALARRGNHVEAELHFREALRLEPANVDAQDDLAALHAAPPARRRSDR